MYKSTNELTLKTKMYSQLGATACYLIPDKSETDLLGLMFTQMIPNPKFEADQRPIQGLAFGLKGCWH